MLAIGMISMLLLFIIFLQACSLPRTRYIVRMGIYNRPLLERLQLQAVYRIETNKELLHLELFPKYWPRWILSCIPREILKPKAKAGIRIHPIPSSALLNEQIYATLNSINKSVPIPDYIINFKNSTSKSKANSSLSTKIKQVVAFFTSWINTLKTNKIRVFFHKKDIISLLSTLKYSRSSFQDISKGISASANKTTKRKAIIISTLNSEQNIANSTNSPSSDENITATGRAEWNKNHQIALFIYMWVTPVLRGQDLGEYLLQDLQEISKLRGDTIMMLICDDQGSGKLFQYYQRQGFLDFHKYVDKAMIYPLK